MKPRVSLLLHRRGEAGSLAGVDDAAVRRHGRLAPTPFTEETAATGLTPLAPLADLDAERAQSAAVDVGGPLETAFGRLEAARTCVRSSSTA